MKYNRSFLIYPTKASCDRAAKALSNNFHDYHSTFKTKDGYQFDNRYDPRVTGVPDEIL